MSNEICHGSDGYERSLPYSIPVFRIGSKEALDKATEQMNTALRESGKKRYIVERNYQPPSA